MGDRERERENRRRVKSTVRVTVGFQLVASFSLLFDCEREGGSDIEPLS